MKLFNIPIILLLLFVMISPAIGVTKTIDIAADTISLQDAPWDPAKGSQKYHQISSFDGTF